MGTTGWLHRIPTFARVLVATTLTLVLAAHISPASASTLGGVHVSAVTTGQADVRAITEVSLDWNTQVSDARAPFVETLTVTPEGSRGFSVGDEIEATVETRTGGQFTATTTLEQEAAQAVLTFDSSDARLSDVERVALVMAGAGESGERTGMDVRGTLDAFTGPLVDTETVASTEYRVAGGGAFAHPHEVSLHLPSTPVTDVLGHRVLVTLERVDAPPISFIQGIRETAQDGGAWVRQASDGSEITVSASLDGVAGYDIALIRTQHWNQSTSMSSMMMRSAVVELDEESPGETPEPVEPGEPGEPSEPGEPNEPEPNEPGDPSEPGDEHADGYGPINLHPGLTYTEPQGPIRQHSGAALDFCHAFAVKNVSAEPLNWSVTFDTTSAPFWGLNPTIVKSGATGALHQISNGKTLAYSEADGHWTVGGVAWNAKLQPGDETQVHFCARPDIPAVDTSTFDTPQVSVEPHSNAYSVALRVSVTSQTPYYVPWQATVDLADYVCESSLPSMIVAENSTLTHVEGTTYLVQGLESAATRYVASYDARSFVFARYSPEGAPFLPGTCE